MTCNEAKNFFWENESCCLRDISIRRHYHYVVPVICGYSPAQLLVLVLCVRVISHLVSVCVYETKYKWCKLNVCA